MIERYTEQEPEEAPMISISIEGLATAVEKRRAKCKAELRIEDPLYTIHEIFKEFHVPSIEHPQIQEEVLAELADRKARKLAEEASFEEPLPQTRQKSSEDDADLGWLAAWQNKHDK